MGDGLGDVADEVVVFEVLEFVVRVEEPDVVWVGDGLGDTCVALIAALTASDSGAPLTIAAKSFTRLSMSDWRELVSLVLVTVPEGPNTLDGGNVFMKSLTIIKKLLAARPIAPRAYILFGQLFILPVCRLGPWAKASVMILLLLTPLPSKVALTAFIKGGGPQM